MSADQQEVLAGILGHVTFYVVLIGVGVGVSFWLGSRRSSKKFVWWPTIVALVLVAIRLLGALNSAGQPEAAVNNAKPESKPEVVRQKLRPGTEFSTDEATLRRIEFNVKQDFAKQIKAAPDDVVVKVRTVKVGKDDLIMEMVFWQSHLVNSQILSIRDGEVIGISCTSSQAPVSPPKFKGTACGTEVSKVLGIDVSTLSGDF